MAKTLKQTVAFLIIFCMLLGAVPLYAAAESDISVVITKTDIKADEVFNTDGYGSLRLLGDPDPEDGTYYHVSAALIDRYGKLIFPYQETHLRYYYDSDSGIVSLTDQHAYIKYGVGKGGKGGFQKPRFYRLDGSEAFAADYDGATPMNGSFAFVVENITGDEADPLSCYIIDKSGNRVYTFTGGFTEKTGPGWGVFGELIDNTKIRTDRFQDGLLRCWSEEYDGTQWKGRIWYINALGETVLTVPEKYNIITTQDCFFSEGLAKVLTNWKVGYIDKTGQEIIPVQYSDGGEFSDGIVNVAKDGKWGYIDATGQTVIPFEYDDACGAGGGLASVAKDGKYGLVDYRNNVVVPLEYDTITPFKDGVAYAIKKSELYIITEAPVASGACGKVNEEKGLDGSQVTWRLDKEGTLTIGGTGEMADHTWDGPLVLWWGMPVKKAIIEPGVTTIGECAFYSNSELTEVSIPDTVTAIHREAFSRCAKLTKVTIPDSVTSIGYGAFSRCSSLTSITIPDTVTEIGSFAFSGCSALEEATIGSGITSIEEEMFSGCSSLRKITIPDSVTNIGPRAFTECTALTDIAVPDGVTSIEFDAFRDCAKLTNITIPDSVTSIGSYSFDGTEWYNGQPDGIVYAGKMAYKYKGGPGEMSLSIKEGTKGIADSAFRGCENIHYLTIPDGVTQIGDYAFYQCNQLRTITIPDGVTSIGSHAFYNCYCAETITVPDSVTSIGSDAFDKTDWYDDQPEGLVYVGKVAYKYKGTIPENTSITIKDGTKGIAGGAFGWDTVLTSVTIPASITVIGPNAFFAKDVYFNGTEQQWNAIQITYGYFQNSLGDTIHFLVETISADNAKETGGDLFTVAGMTAAELNALAGDGATITKADGTALTEQDVVGSGMTLTKSDGTVLTIVVKGDNDGDGKVSSGDARLALRRSVSLEEFTDWQTAASVVSGEDKVTSADARLILRASVGLETLPLV